MNLSILKGLGFGITSGTVTTLGLMVGLHSGTHSKAVIISGVLVIAIADAFSDALGIHISEESGNHDNKHVWSSTIATFLSKFVFALTFLVPIFLFPLSGAIIASIIWGLTLITLFSYYIAKLQQKRALEIIAEHLFITILVIIITHYVGDLVGSFG